MFADSEETMQLEELLLSEKVVTFDFPGLDGLTFDLAYLSKEELQKIIKRCTKSKFNKKTRSVQEELDNDLFIEKYVKAVIRNWSGFKLKYLDEFVVWDKSKVDDLNDELDFSVENAVFLMQNSSAFDNWVSEQIDNLDFFNKDNSKPKPKKSKNTSETPKVASA